MSLSDTGALTSDKKESAKIPTLNPNATEFVPFALRSSSGRNGAADVSTSLVAARNGTGSSGKAVLDRSVSSISMYSDEEAHQYWQHQLPDDITPDFRVMGEDDSQGADNIPFSTLSLHDGDETSRFSTSTGSGLILQKRPEFSHGVNGNRFAENMRYSFPSYGEDAPSANFPLPSKPLGKPFEVNDQLLTSFNEGTQYDGNSRQSLLNEQLMVENREMNPVEVLSSLFPGFAAESLAEVYFANGGDLNLTIEMLTQLELQVDGDFSENLNTKAFSNPHLTSLDFPALPVQDGQNGLPKFPGDDIQKTVSRLFNLNSSTATQGAVDFASAVRKMSSHDAGMWKYDRNDSADASVGSSRSAHVLPSSYNGGHGRAVRGDRLQSRSSSLAAPLWLETGEAVANMYSEMRDEARDHARLRNAYFEQARQAYLIGNKALAKELSVKGQLHNMHMKEAHGKAQESIYRLRNPVSPEMQRNGRGQERMIDLHGLHVSEAIHVLKRELARFRSAAREAEQRLQVYICVGTGHHTKGSRTPARLPIAVQHYLLGEGLDYSEPQPGLLRVVIY